MITIRSVSWQTRLFVWGWLLAILAACQDPEATWFAERATGTPSPPATAIIAVPTAEPASPSPSQAQIGEADPFASLRQEMVEEGVIGWGIDDPDVIAAITTVARHEFVPPDFRSMAYENHPLPIGYGQTISQPYIVALMTQAAAVGTGDQVLEIGTGSGYQAAVLAELVDHVYTIEIVGDLALRAEEVLVQLGYDNVSVRHADGYFGWEEHAPYDAIVVTAAPDHIPQPLVQQLKIGGRLIIPVGPVGGFQTLWQLTRVAEEEVLTQNLGPVSFVPLTRDER